jgi:hypothetical protein
MNRRTDIEDGEADTLAGAAASPFGPPSGPNVLKFPRRAEPPSGFAAGDTPPVSSAFVSLGSATQAVVMRLASNAVRFHGLVPVSGESGGTDRDQFDGLEE